MTTMTLDILRLEFDRDGYASTQVDLDGQKVEVDVSFRDGVRRALLERLAPRVAEVRHLDSDARRSLRENLAHGNEDDAMPLYRSHHLAELEPSLARRFFDVECSDPAADETFLQSMRLVRIGIYPDSEEIVCDYTIGPDVTNYLVAVAFGANGKVYDVSLES
jgi:hypothetical protein